MADISSIKLPSGNTYDIKDSTARSAIPTKVSQLTNDSGFITGMTILSYGSSTWDDFIEAYNANKVVYCRASSNANPASGSQTRLAFMAYVNNATTPTNVEFQYYRSVSSHTASQQGDQVFVYKLDKTSGWSVTTREASVKVVAGDGLGGTYSKGTMTLTGPTKVSDLTNDSGFVASLSDLGITATATELNYTDGVTSNIQDQLDTMAKAVSYTATGAIASFTAEADNMPVTSLVANIEPKQDLPYGDPYPAGGGKNKFYSSISNSVTLNGVTCSFDANTQTFTINGANESSSAYILLSVTPTEDIVRNVALSRAFIGAPTGVYINLVYNDGGWHGLNNGESLPDSVSIENVRIQVGILGTAGSFTTTTFKCQLQEGSTAPTQWYPYSNICPITGHTEVNVTRTGKNLLPNNFYGGVPYNASAGTIVNPTLLTDVVQTGNTYTKAVNSWGSISMISAPLPLGTYKLSIAVTATSTRSSLYVLDGNYKITRRIANSSVPIQWTNAITLNPGEKYIAIYLGSNSAGTVTFTAPQIESGSTATAYEPYQGTTLTVDWTTEAGTVYGGTIDVTTGLLTVDRAVVDMGTLTWNYIASSGHERFVSQSPLSGAKTAGGSIIPNALSSQFAVTSSNGVYVHTKDNTFSVTGEGRAEIYASAYTDAATFKTAVTGQTIVYELATPQTYQLSGQQLNTLLGTNNVWADTGDATVRYIDVDSDLSDYFVEKATYKSGQLLQDKNLAYVESGTKASRAYSVNNYFVNADGALCRITTSVLSGGALIQGTNYIVVTGGLANDNAGGGDNNFSTGSYTDINGNTVTALYQILT